MDQFHSENLTGELSSINDLISSKVIHSYDKPVLVPQDTGKGLPSYMSQLLQRDYTFDRIKATNEQIILERETNQFHYIAETQPKLFVKNANPIANNKRSEQNNFENQYRELTPEEIEKKIQSNTLSQLYIPLDHFYLINLDGASHIDIQGLFEEMLPPERKGLRILLKAQDSLYLDKDLNTYDYDPSTNCITLYPPETIEELFAFFHEVAHSLTNTDNTQLVTDKNTTINKAQDQIIAEMISQKKDHLPISPSERKLLDDIYLSLSSQKQTTSDQQKMFSSLSASERNANALALYLFKSLRDNRGFVDFTNQQIFTHIESVLDSYQYNRDTILGPNSTPLSSHFTNKERSKMRS